MKKEMDKQARELAEVKPMKEKWEQEAKRLSRQVNDLERRYQDQAVELQMAEERAQRGEMQMDRNRGRGTRVSRVSVAKQDENGELPEESEAKYLQILYKQVMPTLNQAESEALKALTNQYKINKTRIGGLIEDNTALD